MRKSFLSTLACACSLLAFLSFTPDAAQHYVNKYASLAVLESVKSGIPASVILAQGIIESGSGNSDLTRRSNNHFGIKWNSGMPYEHTQALDDDYDKAGKKIPSNFVVYANTEESFKHHTEFLMHNSRYHTLFQLARTDYAGWSKGLQDCSYATEKTYAQTLLRTINKYHLDSYDIPAMLEPDDEEILQSLKPVKQQIIVMAVPNKQPARQFTENKETVQTPRIIDIRSNTDESSEGLFEIVLASASTKTVAKVPHKSVKQQVQPVQVLEEGLFEIK